jgi:ATP-dependent helicase HrpA
VITLPPELPITARADELVAAIRDHQVVVVAGETGSGKSTQLPKLCLLAGRGTGGLIGHTQPRRIAARAVAERVAEELGTDLGDLVGYQVRFTDVVGPRTAIKVMTDGILLNELQRDRHLRAYDTIIVDEAHERSLNIDVILGYLRQLLPRRPDLHVVVTSATIDVGRFAAHFAGPDGTPAPTFEVSGRTYPVEVRYRPLSRTDPETGRTTEVDVVDGIVAACAELAAEAPGDVLVFAAGERDIRDAADALRDAARRGPHARVLRDLEVLPLYARLSAAEQHRVFAAHPGCRRVVVATNIAETSLTVPGIRAVVDPGLARISRYGRRSKVQRLPIEEISRASADQRAGRCGRLGPGVCIRLYDEEGYAARPDYTEPELLRTNLASVVLQMTALGLGDVRAFPFVERPDDRAVADGVAVLEELGAIRAAPDAPGGRALTEVGRRLARLPLDPRLGRIVLAAEEEGCVAEALVVVAALSIQDVREHPREQPEAAAALHARFEHPGSDPMGVLRLWHHLIGLRRGSTSNAFRRRCREEHLHHLRVREWQDVLAQVRRVVEDLGIRVPPLRDPDDVDVDALHRAVLAGLLANVGARDGDSREYQGTRGTRFVLGRRSACAARPPAWVVAAELVETTRTFASTVAAVRPEWIERAAGHLVSRTYGEATWDRRSGAATTTERVVLQGLVLVAGRRVPLHRIDPAAARTLFIRHALVEGDWDGPYPFVARNAATVAEVRALEDRVRRRDLLADEDALEAFFDERLPADVVSARHLDRWWRREGRLQPDLLVVPAEVLLAGDADLEGTAAAYPDAVHVGGTALPVSYTFDPARPEADGVTVDVPVEVLAQVDPGQVDWLVPGLRHELVVALIRALPKPLRRGLVPAPETAARVLERISPADGPLLPALARELSREGGVAVPVEAWRGARLPDHLRPRYRVVQGDRVLATGGDLAALRAGVAAHVRSAVAAASPVPERTGLVDWPGGDLPRQVTTTRAGVTVTLYPTLVDEGATAGVRTVATPAEQAAAMRAGTRRLLRLALANPVRTADRELSREEKLALTRAPHADVAAVVEDCTGCVLDALVADAGGPPWTSEAFAALRADVRRRAPHLVVVTARAVAVVVARAADVRARLGQPAPAALEDVRRDVAVQLGRLVFPGFVTATGGEHLRHLPRYLQAMVVRLDTAGRNPARDADRRAVVADLEDEHRLLVRLRPDRAEALRRIRWQLEELRVLLFAEQLGVAEKVSESRIRRALAEVRAAA